MKYAIIAAGEGSRLAAEGVTDDKPLVRIQGEPMLDRLVRIFTQQGATSIAIIVNARMPRAVAHAQQLALAHENTTCPIQLRVASTPSSMHSFYELSSFLADEPFCLTTVDTIFRETDFARYIRAFEQSTCDGMMAVTSYIDDEKPLYVGTDSALRITGFYDEPHQCRYISGGIYCLHPRALRTLRRCLEEGQSRMRNFQRQLVADGLDLRAYEFPKILDIDHASDIEKGEAFLRSAAASSLPIIGVSRAPKFSPHSDDFTILHQVGQQLKAAGEDVVFMDEDTFTQQRPQARAIFSMARSKETLEALDVYIINGIPVLNPPQGVRRCARPELTELLERHHLPRPHSCIVRIQEADAAKPPLSLPCWVKRGDSSAQQKEDIAFVCTPQEWHHALTDFRQRGIEVAVVNEHLEGDIVKFYGVANTPFFFWYYPTLGTVHSKFGLEEINGPAQAYPFHAEALKECADRIALLAETPVYGGDCIIDSAGAFRFIDFNDWPSFSRCTETAARAIASYIQNLLTQNDR